MKRGTHKLCLYSEELEIRVTPYITYQLQQIRAFTGKPVSEVVREALYNSITRYQKKMVKCIDRR